jgi:hypothetical protein
LISKIKLTKLYKDTENRNVIVLSYPAKALDIINKAEEAQNRSEQALKVANDKLTKMLQLKQKRLSKDLDNGQGPAFIAELISAGSLFSFIGNF